ncbi:MAG TPA: class I SAM-dependent methyltransferase [Herpetosiphonaceae bacterium]
MTQLNPLIRYPFYGRAPTRLERALLWADFSVIKCLVCGDYARMHSITANFRESCHCAKCGSFNRQRQMAYMILHALTSQGITGLSSLADVARRRDLKIYNTEATGALHNRLKRMPGYQFSQYYGDAYESGTMVDGIMHQDLMRLSFADNSLDLVLSSDVFEHVADPYKAHAEVFRVLKPGGRHLFTAPFFISNFYDGADRERADLVYYYDDVRAEIGADGKVTHHRPPIFHGDPVSIDPRGALVFTIFGLEMLVKLADIGFLTNMFLLYKPLHGILGNNAIFFEAVKL